MSYNFRSLALKATVVAAAAVISATAFAQEPSQQTVMQNPADWGFPAGNYANWRHSTLKQIDTNNVAKLQVAWTMSTGVLRGHEGSPLVIGDTMYYVTPFPNNVFALNLNNLTYRWKYEPTQSGDVVPIMCCDTVNRGLG
ncbi:MAG: PQQ-dependent dehydrogenase, methanol/ethanol family, partial [Sciscionella sp.]